MWDQYLPNLSCFRTLRFEHPRYTDDQQHSGLRLNELFIQYQMRHINRIPKFLCTLRQSLDLIIFSRTVATCVACKQETITIPYLTSEYLCIPGFDHVLLKSFGILKGRNSCQQICPSEASKVQYRVIRLFLNGLKWSWYLWNQKDIFWTIMDIIIF